MVGRELHASGWDQGCLVRTRCTQGSPSQWDDQQPDVDGEDEFIIISHTCDIVKSVTSEPYIDVLRVFWTKNKGLIKNARKNMSRFRLIGIRGSGADRQGLIADAGDRRRVDKTALLGLTPRPCFGPDNLKWFRIFRDWLAARYNRLAVPDDEIEAIHKPIARAVRELGDSDPLWETLHGIDEIIYYKENGGALRLVVVFLCYQPGDASSEEEERAAELADWLQSILKKHSVAEIVDWKRRSVYGISYGSYVDATVLDLDDYSQPGEDVVVTGAVSGNAEEPISG